MSEIAVMLLPDFHFLWVEKCQSFSAAAQSQPVGFQLVEKGHFTLWQQFSLMRLFSYYYFAVVILQLL